MDCDSCGRYRPSSEIAPLRAADGRLVMACARCRRLVVVDGRSGPAARPRPTAALVATPR